MSKRIRLILTVKLLELESTLIDTRLWFLRRIEQLLKRQINLLETIKIYAESEENGV